MDWQMQGPPHLTPFDTVPRNTSLDALHFPFPTIRSSRILADFPSEMLAEIFFHASSNADEDFDKWDVIIEKLGRDIQCITVSHVCRRWRSIALENPLLWTWIYDKFYTERALEMMRRAKSCPLTVVSRTVSINDAVLEAFPSHLFHLQHLILELDYDTAKSLTSRLVHSAPVLETLRLEVEIGHSGVAYPDLPPNFLASVVPKLQILKLIGVLLPQTSAFYKNLTRFCFAFPEDHSYMYAERCPHPNITIDILHEMPLLEVLELERALPPAGSLLHPHSRRVSFPRLRHIILSGTPQECADLVSCLDFPKATQIRLFSIELGEEDPVDPIISMLQRCYHDLPVPIDELHIDLYNPDELTIEAKTRNSESSYIFSIELFVPEDPDSPLAEAANIARRDVLDRGLRSGFRNHAASRGGHYQWW
ncbi:hypothetical protein OF83DRAFT_702939 [Amylostereum chailletii]|nr:hypothetical protein OF83DRAFT_702939 [Amylostereum chailletii]